MEKANFLTRTIFPFIPFLQELRACTQSTGCCHSLEGNVGSVSWESRTLVMESRVKLFTLSLHKGNGSNAVGKSPCVVTYDKQFVVEILFLR